MITFQFANDKIHAKDFLGATREYEKYIAENIESFKQALQNRTLIPYLGEKPLVTVGYIKSIVDEYLSLLFELFPKDLDLKRIGNKYNIAEIATLQYYEYADTLKWGKYKGMQLATIVNQHPDYLLWCVLHLDKFVIDPFIFILDNVKSQFAYFEAIGLNSLKYSRLKEWESNNSEENYKDKYSDYDTFRDAFDGDINAWRQFND